MKCRRQITVDLFVDDLTPDVPLDEIREGIDVLNQHGSLFRVRDGVQEFVPAPGDEEYIRADNTSISELSADLGILVTGRYLATQEHFKGGRFMGPKDKEGLLMLGLAHMPKLNNLARFAIVGAGERFGEGSDKTVRHEIAHLLGVKQEGLTFDGAEHCMCADCTMAAVDEAVEEFVEVDVVAKHIASRRPRIRKEKQLISRPANQDKFCNECEDQFYTNADIFRRMLAGWKVSEQLVSKLFSHDPL